jgi:hypothetical protein
MHPLEYRCPIDGARQLRIFACTFLFDLLILIIIISIFYYTVCLGYKNVPECSGSFIRSEYQIMNDCRQFRRVFLFQIITIVGIQMNLPHKLVLTYLLT